MGCVLRVVGNEAEGRQTGYRRFKQAGSRRVPWSLSAYFTQVNLVSSLTLLANLQEKESFIDVVYDGSKKAARQRG